MMEQLRRWGFVGTRNTELLETTGRRYAPRDAAFRDGVSHTPDTRTPPGATA